MSVPFFDLTEQYRSVSGEVNEALKSVMEGQRFILGPEVKALEEEVAAFVGSTHAVGVASGTDALLLSLKALGAEPGSDVLLPSFTFFATAGAVWNTGLRPVFCDVDPTTFNVTAETLSAAWTDKTAAVIPVHLFGQMAPMREIRDLARDRGAFVLEDCAQAMGADSAMGKAGSVGNAGAFSFFPTKNLGGFGDGGMVTTSDVALAERVAKLRVHGGTEIYHHEIVGTNSRLDALQAAVLRVKLEHLDGWEARRRENAACYARLLEAVPGLTLPSVAEGNTHVYNQFTVRVSRRDELKEHLADDGIGSAVYYPVPLHLQACFAELGGREGDLPATEALSREVLSLPIYPELGEHRLARVAQSVKGFYE